MGCLNEVIDKKSPKQIADIEEITKQELDSNYHAKEIEEQEADKEKCKEK